MALLNERARRTWVAVKGPGMSTLLIVLQWNKGASGSHYGLQIVYIRQKVELFANLIIPIIQADQSGSVIFYPRAVLPTDTNLQKE
jgi:hypothetical protein